MDILLMTPQLTWLQDDCQYREAWQRQGFDIFQFKSPEKYEIRESTPTCEQGHCSNHTLLGVTTQLQHLDFFPKLFLLIVKWVSMLMCFNSDVKCSSVWFTILVSWWSVWVSFHLRFGPKSAIFLFFFIKLLLFPHCLSAIYSFSSVRFL